MSERTGTFTFGDALSSACKGISRQIQDDYGQIIVNLALNSVWIKYDWRESVTILPNFYLIPNEQDHGSPSATVPSDFFGLRWVNLVRANTIPPMRWPLQIIRDLLLTHIRALPHAICYEPSKQAFRLFNRVPENIGSPEYLVEGKYKIRPTKITNINSLVTILPFDDMYFQVWVEMMKYHAMNIAGDPRAGEFQSNGRSTTYTGQAAKANFALDQMAQAEGLELGDPVISPNEPLVNTGSWRPNMFGIGMGY